MPTTYQSSRCSTGAVPVYKETGVFHDSATYEAAGASAIVANDVIQMVPIPGGNAPNGVEVIDVILTTDDCGTATADVGDGDDPDYLIDGADIGAAAGCVARRGSGVSVLVAAGFPKIYTTNDTLDVKIASSSANVEGTIRLDVFMRAL